MEGNGQLEQVAVLAEPSRRRVYEQLLRESAPVGRRQLAGVLEISENLLTFHLAKLADAGLVRVVAPVHDTRRRGRPARLYEAARMEVDASVPPRRYDRVAELLVLAAREQAPNESFQSAAERIAASQGRELGSAQAASTADIDVETLPGLLEGMGYQPRPQGSDVFLDNCPFDRLRAVNTPLVCGVNHALLQGYVQGCGLADNVAARLEPDSVRCCVVLGPAGPG